MEDDESSSKFCEEDIEMILKRRTKVIQIESGVKGSTFAKVSMCKMKGYAVSVCDCKVLYTIDPETQMVAQSLDLGPDTF